MRMFGLDSARKATDNISHGDGTKHKDTTTAHSVIVWSSSDSKQLLLANSTRNMDSSWLISVVKGRSSRKLDYIPSYAAPLYK